MRSLVIVKLAPFLNDDLGFPARDEPFPIQAFVVQLAIEAFLKPVLPGAARLDIGGADILVPQPLHHCRCRKFRAIVRPDVGRFAIQPHQARQRQNHVLVAQ